MTAPTPDPEVYREDLFPGLTSLVDGSRMLTLMLVNGMYVVMADAGPEGKPTVGVGTTLLGAFNHLQHMMEVDR